MKGNRFCTKLVDTIKYEFRTVYAQNDDITFIILSKQINDNDMPLEYEVGFYYGEPNEQLTEHYILKYVKEKFKEA